ncbi:hypothetical protein FIV42_28990 [Persicimonas caeni]|uniref:Uncharacterized protein n=1 Tax=Persicimonas caeni TaxID=2292766 RepID=A0A4Y6Q246_PERCE|nr:hypothetical protein [Persicimonas caeni]QDG54636.1 hypothetical protein FIV42_28990 [Persicimonas caeni]QED35857.1 hypothetical protein FRD00_28985 [Persicimonas caeni]
MIVLVIVIVIGRLSRREQQPPITTTITITITEPSTRCQAPCCAAVIVVVIVIVIGRLSRREQQPPITTTITITITEPSTRSGYLLPAEPSPVQPQGSPWGRAGERGRYAIAGALSHPGGLERPRHPWTGDR